MASKVFILILLGLSAFACGRADTVRTEHELYGYAQDEDNGLRKSMQIDDYTVSIMNKPIDLLVSQAIDTAQLHQEKIDSLRSKYSSYYYFVVSLSRNNKEALHNTPGGTPQFSGLVQTLSFHMRDYVTMTTNEFDTIPVSDFILDRTFGSGNSTELLFVFDKEETMDSEWIQFNLNEFGLGIGNQRFRFRSKDLEQVPEIEFATTPK